MSYPDILLFFGGAVGGIVGRAFLSEFGKDMYEIFKRSVFTLISKSNYYTPHRVMKKYKKRKKQERLVDQANPFED